jgi:hypothetical protein
MSGIKNVMFRAEGDFDRAYLSEADEDGDEGVEAEILATGSLARMGLVDEDDDEGGADDYEGYDVVPDPKSEAVDLSKLRGVGSAEKHAAMLDDDNNSDTELENLAELVPDVKSRRKSNPEDGVAGGGGKIMTAEGYDMPERDCSPAGKSRSTTEKERKHSLNSGGRADSTGGRRLPVSSAANRTESMKVQESKDIDDDSRKVAMPAVEPPLPEDYQAGDEASSGRSRSIGDYPDSDLVVGEDSGHEVDEHKIIPKEFMNMSSGQSISTATQTHEVRMPMYLPTFKPATGCTNASDFIVRCFVARLRAGITVVKHGRSRWCKSRLRLLHIHPDGRSLSWKPAEGEPASSRRPPKLDLSTCLEVRHAWSPDPQNPMYTGTPILRQKCEAVNAHKSFALIFKSRTVDITAVTADQCKVLMEGFSALCFRLQVANLAGRAGGKKGGGGAHARPMPEEDGVSTTASVTNTNSSTPRAR